MYRDLPIVSNDCSIQLLVRSGSNWVRVAIYMPNEERNPRQNGTLYFQKHFADKTEQVLRDINLILTANPNFKQSHHSLEKPPYYFAIETYCTNEELAAIEARDRDAMAKIPAVAAMKLIAESY